MKNTAKRIIGVLLGFTALFLLFFTYVYYSRLKTIGSIEKLTDYDDGYDLYSMTVEYNYSVQNIIDSEFSDTQEFVDAVIKESLPLLPVHIKLPSYGCSVYRATTDGNDVIMGRNYDFKLDTSAMLVRCNPKDGYKSIAFGALDNVGADKATANMRSKMACLTAPFICLDGVNEKGVSIAVLTLDSEPTLQDTGRERIATSLAIRLVLDYAASTQEAVDLLRSYDMMATNGRDYHFFISDATGDSRTVEYDCKDENRTLVDTNIQAVTNFYAMYIDNVESYQRNGIYGHGKERYDRMMEVLDEYNGVIPYEDVFRPLQAAASNPSNDPENVTSNTQWSVVFNNTKGIADITLRRKWGDVYSFSLF